HRRRLVQDVRVGDADVPELGLERRVRSDLDRARRHTRHSVAAIEHVVHRLRSRHRPAVVRMGAPDVRWRGKEGVIMDRNTQNAVVAAALVAAAIAWAPGPEARANDSREKMRQQAADQSSKAAKAFEAVMQVPDKAIPKDLIGKAKAIAVF